MIRKLHQRKKAISICQYKLAIFGGLLALLLSPASFSASIYGYTDENGEIHLSTVAYDARYILLSTRDQVNGALERQSRTLPVHPFASLVKAVADKEQVDEALLHAVMKTESGFDPNAMSRKGAVGLMQLMPATAKRYGISNPRDPGENIAGGALYLKDLLRVFNNDLQLVLAAYNAGETAVANYGNKIPPYRETKDYVQRALAYYRSFSGCETYRC